MSRREARALAVGTQELLSGKLRSGLVRGERTKMSDGEDVTRAGDRGEQEQRSEAIGQNQPEAIGQNQPEAIGQN